MSVRLFKKRDVTESRYGQNISSRSSSRKLGKVDDQGMRDGFILLGIHVITGGKVRRRPKGEWQQTRQRYDKSLTKIYTTWARMLSDRNIFCSLGGGEKRRGSMPLGRFLLHLWHPTRKFRPLTHNVVVFSSHIVLEGAY